ncbi:MAG TPA: small basic protein [Phycisphaerales bacterium]|nr:small basic protein [Phycisphaerales bacterium]
MSMDPSLKIKGALSRHRNVLSRAERIEMLAEEGNWEEGDPVTGLQKVGHRKSHSGKKGGDDEKTAEEEAAAAAEGTEETAEDSK